MKFTFDKFRTEKIAVWCRTRLEAEEFLKLCKENGLCWKSDASIGDVTHWNVYGERTLYTARYDLPKLEYHSPEWARSRGYLIIPASGVLRPGAARDDSIPAFEYSRVSLEEFYKNLGKKDSEMLGFPDVLQRPVCGRSARWRDAESDKQKRDGEYIVCTTAIVDCEFSRCVDMVKYDIANGWTYIEDAVITHWLDNAPALPEVVVR